MLNTNGSLLIALKCWVFGHSDTQCKRSISTELNVVTAEDATVEVEVLFLQYKRLIMGLWGFGSEIFYTLGL